LFGGKVLEKGLPNSRPEKVITRVVGKAGNLHFQLAWGIVSVRKIMPCHRACSAGAGTERRVNHADLEGVD